MKIIRLKLLSGFRGLAKDFEIKFINNTINSESIEPICLIGLNGSGKSNVLEVISEIFYYLETFSKATKSEIKNFKKDFGFEIEYIISKNVYNQRKSNEQKEFEDYQIKILIKKDIKKAPIAIAYDSGEEFISQDPTTFSSYLPERIIAYSSGMNELLSNPYIKIDFEYLDDFIKLSKNNKKSMIDENRLFYMDYDANKLITICNFIFDKTTKQKNQLGVINLKPIKRELKIKKLHSFSFSINLRDNNNKPILLPSLLNIAIENLKKCSTLFEEKKILNKEPYSTYEFYFHINNATKQLFKTYFKNARELFKTLYYLRLLNNHLIGKDTQDAIKNAKENTNISAMLPKYEESKKVFNISDIAFKKWKINKPVYYKQLSDGEYQFLHVFGSLLLMDSLGTLFLFDEPETHFNPDWRSKFVSIINEALFDDETTFREQELILTTHSPFIVSDCQKENVYIFEKDENFKVKKPENPEYQTFGTSIEMIYWNIFKKQQSISNVAKKELDEIGVKIINNELNKELAIEALKRFGDSFEKMSIVKIIREKYPQ